MNNKMINPTQTRTLSSLAQLRAKGFKIECGMEMAIQLDDGTRLGISCGELRPSILITASSSPSNDRISAELTFRKSSDTWHFRFAGGVDGVGGSTNGSSDCTEADEKLSKTIAHISCLQSVLTLCTELKALANELDTFSDHMIGLSSEDGTFNIDWSSINAGREFIKIYKPITRCELEALLTDMSMTTASARHLYRIPSPKDCIGMPPRFAHVYSIGTGEDASSKRIWLFNGERISLDDEMSIGDMVEILAQLKLHKVRQPSS